MSEILEEAMDFAARSLVDKLDTNMEGWAKRAVEEVKRQSNRHVGGPAQEVVKPFVIEMERVAPALARIGAEAVKVLLGRAFNSKFSDYQDIHKLDYAERRARTHALNQGWLVSIENYAADRASIIEALKRAGVNAAKAAIPYLLLLL